MHSKFWRLGVIGLLLTSFSLAFACKTQSQNAASFERIAEAELGSNFSTELNTDKSFVLCNQNRVNDHINSIFRYCVIDVRANQIVHKGSYQRGSVKWLDNDNIEVTTTEKFSIEPIKKTIQINNPQQ